MLYTSSLASVWVPYLRYVVLVQKSYRERLTLCTIVRCRKLVILRSHSVAQPKSLPFYLVTLTTFPVPTLLAISRPLLLHWLVLPTTPNLRLSFAHLWPPQISALTCLRGDVRKTSYLTISLEQCTRSSTVRFQLSLEFPFGPRVSQFLLTDAWVDIRFDDKLQL